MKSSQFVEFITVKKPTDEFIWKLVRFLVIRDFTGFVLTSNTEFEIILLNALFS